MEDARVMVDLLKLAVAKRVGVKGKETLAAVLTTMGKTNTEVKSFTYITEYQHMYYIHTCVSLLLV